MRIAICDDEEVQRQLLTKYLQEWAEEQCLLVEVVPFPDAESFLFQWEEDKDFELLVLDVEMGQLNGVELAKQLRKEGQQVPVLFITGYESYMAQGYEVSALHYLLKPVNKEKLFEVLQRLVKEQKPEQKILLQTEEGCLSIVPSDMWYVEAAGHYCILTTTSGLHNLKHSISEMRKLLEKEKGFMVCHRSFLVNLKHVSSIMKTDLVMDNGIKIPISRGSAKAVNEAFIRFYTP